MKATTKSVTRDILLTDSVQQAVEIIKKHFAVDFITFHLVNNLRLERDNPFVRTTYPAEWVSYYLLNNLVVTDPILKYSISTEQPFNWADLILTKSEKDFMEKSLEYGVGPSGYSIPCSDAIGRKSILTITSSVESAEWQDFLEESSAELVDLSQDMHVKGVTEAFSVYDRIPSLSPREHECLSWTAEGKTYSEIAIILDLSEHTVRSYLKVARLKLHSTSLAQATTKASSFGLI